MTPHFGKRFWERPISAYDGRHEWSSVADEQTDCSKYDK